MSRRQSIQSANGVALECDPYGILDVIRTAAPAGGEIGFAPGCVWRVPSTAGAVAVARRYMNTGGNGKGSNPTATWVAEDNSGYGLSQLGGALSLLGYMGSSGNLYRKVFPSGGSPASTAADIVIDSFVLPANSFDVAGRMLCLTAGGNFAANGNTKTAKLWFNCTTAPVGAAVTGGTAIATTGASTGNNVGWLLSAQVMKYGAAGSNTQNYQELATVVGTTHGGVGLSAALTATENAGIICAVTINAATTATDGTVWWWEAAGFN